MPEYDVELPNGKKYTISGDDAAIKTQLAAVMGSMAGGQGIRTAADVQGFSTDEAQALVQREVAANEALREAKKGAVRGAIPIVVGMATAPLTAGLGTVAAILGQGAIAAGTEAATQMAFGEDLDKSKIAWEGVLGGAFELPARGFSYLGRALGGRLPLATTKKNLELMDSVARTGAPMTRAEVFGGPFARFLQRWTDSSTFGKELSTERRMAVVGTLKKSLDDALNLISSPTSPLATREKTEALMKTVHDGWNKVAGRKFNEARRLAPQGAVIDLTETVDEARRILSESRGGLRGKMPTTLSNLTAEDKVLSDFLADAEKIIPEQSVPSALVDATGKALPANVIPAQRTVQSLSVEQATELRKLFNEKYYQYLNSGDRAASRTLKEFEQKFDASLSRQVGGPNSPYMQKLTEAKRFYAEGYKVWDVSLVSALLDKNPSKTISLMDVTDPFALETLQKAFALHGKHTSVQQGMGLVRRQALQNMIQDSALTTAGKGIAEAEEVVLRADSLRSRLMGLDARAADIIFSGADGKRALTTLNDSLAIAERMNKMSPGGGDRLMSQIAMGIWGVAHKSPAMVTASTINLAAPKFLAGIMNEPVTAEHVRRAMLYGEKSIKNPKFYATYLQELARGAEVWRRSNVYRDMRREAEAELAAIEEERGKRGIPQRSKPDR